MVIESLPKSGYLPQDITLMWITATEYPLKIGHIPQEHFTQQILYSNITHLRFLG